jgi:tripartite-type tricarboxylate transporter receptor subunit TctC
VPAGTPDDIVTRLRAAAKNAAADPQLVQTINRAGSPIEYLDAPEFQSYWTADAALMNEAVKKIGKVE